MRVISHAEGATRYAYHDRFVEDYVGDFIACFTCFVHFGETRRRPLRYQGWTCLEYC